MNPVSTILNLFRKQDKRPSDAEKRWYEGYNAHIRGRELYYSDHLHGGNRPDTERMRKALACFDKAIESGFEESGVYGDRGSCLQSLGFDLDAIDDFDKAVLSEPKDSNLYFMRSLSKGATGDLQGRVADLEEAIRVARAEPGANEHLAQMASEKGTNLLTRYEHELLSARLDLEMQKNRARLLREHPGLDLGLDPFARRRAESRRRGQ